MIVSLTASSRSPASPTTVYDVLTRFGFLRDDQILSEVPYRYVVFRRSRSGPVAEHLVGLELVGESGGGTRIRCRVDLLPGAHAAGWLSRLLVRRSVCRLVRQLAKTATHHDYDAGPY